MSNYVHALCENCKHWSEATPREPGLPPDGGTCHLNPPAFFAPRENWPTAVAEELVQRNGQEEIDVKDADITGRAGFPITHKHSHCSHHKKRDNEQHDF